MIRRSVIMLAAVILTALTAMSQMPKGVDWSMNVKMTTATKGVLTIRANVEPGWHLYGTDIPEGGPSATTITVSTSTKDITLQGKLKPSVAPVKVKDEMFGMELTWWDAPVSFTCPIVLKSKTTSGTISATITNMACNDQTCIPPSTEELKVKVGAATQTKKTK